MNNPKQVGSRLYRFWMKFASGLAFVNTVILLSLVYFLLIGPISLILRVLGKDLLERRLGSGESFWKEKEKGTQGIEGLKHQF